jgi:hypothetical protein
MKGKASRCEWIFAKYEAYDKRSEARSGRFFMVDPS